MALLSNWLNSEKFDVLRDIINSIVSAVNPAGGGAKGNILRKNSNTDFDYTFTDEFAYKCIAASSSFPVNGVGVNYITRSFTVPSAMQWSEGYRVRATAMVAGVVQNATFIEGVIVSYSASVLTIMVDTIKGSGSFTQWLINGASGGDSEIIIQSTTPVAGNPAILGTASISSENYLYTYRKRGNLLFLSFKAIIIINVGAVVTKIKIPMPTGILKDTAGSGFSMYGHASYNAPGSTTDIVPLIVTAVDDGTEGQRLVLERTSGANMTISNGVTLTLKGSIIMPIL